MGWAPRNRRRWCRPSKRCGATPATFEGGQPATFHDQFVRALTRARARMRPPRPAGLLLGNGGARRYPAAGS
ncbi:hypothetical protein BXP26_07485 [Mycobacterium tuberculosis variant bovis]|nr:hypothetical protein BXP26_07485 [Mycobacterium tuberculosis variant bovis]